MTSRKILYFAPPIAAFLVLAYAFFPESIDDAYITLRYSLNLARGHGPVFNVGEYVEGYSNPAWMFLLALTGKTGLSMPMMMKVYGVISGLVAIIIAGRVASRYHGMIVGSAAMMLLGASTFFAMWATDGLETTFYSALLTGLYALTLSESANALIIGMLAALAAMTRPEGAMFGLIVCSFLVKTRGVKTAAVAFTPLAIATCAYEIFRVSYFGEFVPNTALVKLHTTLGAAINGFKYLLAFNADSGYIVLPSVILGALLFRNRRYVVLGTCFIAAQMLFLAVSGGDFMYAYRFVMPIFPIMSILIASCANARAFSGKVKALQRIASFAAIATVAAAQAHSLPPKKIALDNLTARRSVHFEVACFAAMRTTSQDTIALSEAGIIPFKVKARVFDYLGLTSSYKETYGHRGVLEVSKLFAARPKFIILTFFDDGAGVLKPRLSQDAQIAGSTQFKEQYTEVRRFLMTPSSDYLDQIYYKYTPDAKEIYFVVYQRRGT